MTVLFSRKSVDGNMWGSNPDGDKAFPEATAKAHTITGIAPVFISFNAIDENVPGKYFNRHYLWDYGEGAIGNHSISGEPKNSDAGPVVGHVYDTAGVYTVTLTINDASDVLVETQTVNITVTDPDIYYSGNNTVCISQTGTFTGAPAGALQITAASNDIYPEIQPYILTDKRVLLNRGEIWTTATTNLANDVLSFDTVNNCTLGAYGTGALPHLLGTDKGTSRYYMIKGSNTYATATSGNKVLDTKITGTYFTPTHSVNDGWIPIELSGRANNFLVHRSEIHGGIVWMGSNSGSHMSETPPLTPITQAWCVSDSIFTQPDPVTGHGVGIFLHGTDCAMINANMFLQGSQMVRTNWGKRMFYGHSEMRNDNLPSPRNIYKIQSQHSENAWFANDKEYAYTEHMNIYANNWQWGDGQSFPLSGGRTDPTAVSYDQNSNYVLWHGNWMRTVGTGDAQGLCDFEQNYGVFRNNIIDLTGWNGSGWTFLVYSNSGNKLWNNPLVTDFYVYNNTVCEFGTVTTVDNLYLAAALNPNNRNVEVTRMAWYLSTTASKLLSPDRISTVSQQGPYTTDDPIYDPSVRVKDNVKHTSNPFVSLVAKGTKFSDYTMTDNTLSGADASSRRGQILEIVF